eukprot:15476756-Alexandrium_andersonii.AAC.1
MPSSSDSRAPRSSASRSPWLSRVGQSRPPANGARPRTNRPPAGAARTHLGRDRPPRVPPESRRRGRRP